MLNLFKRLAPKPPEMTLAVRVRGFWQWYAAQAPRFYAEIEAGRSPGLADEVSTKVDEFLPGFAWCFGPGANGRGHSFTLSGEANRHKQFITEFWRTQAPQLDGWTFYSAKQPSGELDGWVLEVGGNRFAPLEFWLAPSLQPDEEKIDIVAWHPLFSQLEERDQWGVFFLVLDEVLGEVGTQTWIGEIKMGTQRLADSMPIKELPQFIEKTKVETGWNKHSPTETWSTYQFPEPHDRFPRADVIAGSTRHLTLLGEHLEAEGNMDDPLEGLGADFVFVQFDAAFLPEGEETAARGNIEDALEAALEAANAGITLGGAHGTRFAYVDLLLFDGERSLNLVRDVLVREGLPKGTAIEFFAKSQRTRRISL